VDDPEYVRGLRAAVRAALDYGISGIDSCAEQPPPVPEDLPAQARFAARSGVPLDIVLRRYFAGYVLLGDFVIEIADECGTFIRGAELRRLWRSEAALFDRLIAAVAEEYTIEVQERPQSNEQRRVERVRRLLDGELLDAPELRYRFDSWHLGALASGPGASRAIRDLGAALNRSPLIVRPGGEMVWAWFGGREGLSTREVLSLASASWPAEVFLAIGEPAHGLDGWRLSHQQARAALPIAMRGGPNLIRYTDVALLAAAMHDEVLARSLQTLYLAPLAKERDGGQVLCETLRAYFTTGRNVSAAAAALGVSWPTVKSRLHLVEERIGRPLDLCGAELETALHLQDVETTAPA
jgi:hypothetical protein